MSESPTVLESARTRLAHLVPIAERLNAATDDFTSELKAIEAELGRIALGIAYEDPTPFRDRALELRDGGGDCEIEAAYLAYDRVGNRWRLLVRVYAEKRDSDGEVEIYRLVHETPLVEASRELRLAAAEDIEDFVDHLAKEAMKKLKCLKKFVKVEPSK